MRHCRLWHVADLISALSTLTLSTLGTHARTVYPRHAGETQSRQKYSVHYAKSLGTQLSNASYSPLYQRLYRYTDCYTGMYENAHIVLSSYHHKMCPTAGILLCNQHGSYI